MNEIDIITLPYFDDNYSYVIQPKNSTDVAIVDCGDSSRISDYLKRHSLNPVYVMLTHSHYDHAGDLDGLKEDFPGVTVVKPAGESRITGKGLELGNGDTISLGDHSITAYTTPAHTKYCTCFHINGCLFVGDVLFSGGCGRLFEGDQRDLESAMDKLKSFPDETLVYVGHEYTSQNLRFALDIEPENSVLIRYENDVRNLIQNGKFSTPTTIAKEKEINPFFRIDETNVIKKVDPDRRLERSERMGILRKMKDEF